MERTPFRVAFGLVASLGLVGIGSCGGTKHPAGGPGCETADDHFVNVRSNALSCDKARIDISEGHQVFWRSAPGTLLEIEFEGASPFPDLTCRKNACMSMAPDPNALGSADEREFKYRANPKSQTESASATTAAGTPTPTHPPGLYGRIIIRK